MGIEVNGKKLEFEDLERIDESCFMEKTDGSAFLVIVIRLSSYKYVEQGQNIILGIQFIYIN